MAVDRVEPDGDAPVGETIKSVKRFAGPMRIPSSRYVSPEWADVEAERLWPRTWQLACTSEHLASTGDYFEYRLGRLSVVLVRGEDGVVRGFQNVQAPGQRALQRVRVVEPGASRLG